MGGGREWRQSKVDNSTEVAAKSEYEHLKSRLFNLRHAEGQRTGGEGSTTSSGHTLSAGIHKRTICPRVSNFPTPRSSVETFIWGGVWVRVLG